MHVFLRLSVPVQGSNVSVRLRGASVPDACNMYKEKIVRVFALRLDLPTRFAARNPEHKIMGLDCMQNSR